MLNKNDISVMKDGEGVSGLVVFQNIEERLTRNGTSSYLMGNLQCQGAVPFKVWSNSSCFKELSTNPEKYRNVVCEIRGKVNIYDGSTSIIVDSCRLSSGSNLPDVSDFFESKYDANRFWDSLYGMLVKNCSKEAISVFDLVMKDYKESFLKEFAAVSHHDNCKGGLLGHTTKVTKIASILNLYPELVNRCGGKDVLYVGCALHDIGKIVEYCNGAVSSIGLKVSHMIVGAMMLQDYKEQIITLKGEDFFYSLVSIVSGHAGEYGDRPRTVAAYVVHLLDSLESNLTSLNELCDNPQQLFYDGMKLN